MFSSGPGNQSPSPFSRGGKRGPAPFARGREVHTMIMAIAGLAVIALLASMFIKGDVEKLPVAEVDELTPMELPVLDGAPPLPSAAEVADRKNQAEFLKDELQALRLRDLDPLTLAWAKLQLAEDAAAPPVPQRFPVKDLMLGQVRIGTSLVLSGLVISTSSEKVGEEEWTRLVCQVFGEDDQYVQGLVVPGAPYVEPGQPHYLVGRYAGTASLPAEEGPSQRLPVIAVRLAKQVRDTKFETLVNLDDEVWRPDPTVYVGIDDDGTLLETRPYYYTLGQVVLDSSTPGAYDEPGDANQECSELHFNAAAHRGDIYTVRGKVYRAFEDYLVSRDTPYGVQRVFRIWIGWFERHDGKTGRAHVYEVAAIVGRDAALPEPGDLIRATGRFLKVQGYKVGFSFMRDMAHGVTQRSSDKAYFKLFVTPGFEQLPKPQHRDWFWVKLTFTIVAFSLMVCMVVMINREHRHDNEAMAPQHKLREGRRRLKQRRREARQVAAAEEGEEPAAAEEAEPPAPSADEPG